MLVLCCNAKNSAKEDEDHGSKLALWQSWMIWLL
jgi:hypothetical protein